MKGTNAPHVDVFEGDDVAEEFEEGQVFHRAKVNAGSAEHTWQRASYQGVGYKRSHEDGSKGSPGYASDLIKDKSSDLTDDASISISEIMYETSRNAPQWIELYNNSGTQAVNLNEWKLKFENADDADIRKPAVTTNNLPSRIIQPQQTVLIVSRRTGSVSRESLGRDDFPATRIINLYDQKEKLEVDTQNYKLLSTTAFRVTLMQKGHKDGDTPVDVAGNMGDDGTTLWDLPASEDGEGRSSIIRRYDKDVARLGTLPAWSGDGSLGAEDGGEGNAGWIFAVNANISGSLYYGRRDDIGTPGHRATGPLPVSLSKFRPERLESGEIVVRWVTESELNNAGFNILRSDTRDGEFTKITTALIAGQGTTSERTAYEWKDTSAKPNVTYYYQIQDVSLDGDVQTLRTSRLKGDISADGKLTTTWGELKALQ